MTYTRWWVRVWAVVGALGVGVAILEWSLLVTAAAVLGIGLCTALVLGLLTAEAILTPVTTSARTYVVTRSLAAGAGTVALLAVGALSPPVLLLVGVLLLVTAPPLVSRLVVHRHREPRPRPAGPPTGEPRPPLPDAEPPGPASLPDRRPGLGQLGDHQLCGLWRQTFWELRDQQTVDEVLAMIALRQACLDELERRNPAALHAWLDSGARASGGPERFWLPDDDSGRG
jgi:hypothetical protein